MHVPSKTLHGLRVGFIALTVFQFNLGGPLAASLQAHEHEKDRTRTPIKHVIVLIGENRTFDHIFATYVPKSQDFGYIQPLDFFGDGPRIPLIVVSPFSRGGHISHTYTEHVSILKFIERNWKLKPLTNRSRDNFPNPVVDDDDPYVPINSPALGDLFDFGHHGVDHDGDDN